MTTINEEHAIKKFYTANSTQDSILALSLWMFSKKVQHQKVVEVWYKAMKKSKIAHRLVLFYVCNEVVQTCKRKHAIIYKDAFKEVLKDAVLLVREASIRPKIERIFKVWAERSVYDSEYVDELQALLCNQTPRPPTDSKLISDFQAEKLMESIVEYTDQEGELELKYNQVKNLRFDASNIEAVKQLKDRAHGKGFSQQFEDACNKYEDYVKNLDKVFKDHTALVENLEQAEIYYDAQYAEARIVSNAYKNFGTRVNNLKRKLNDKVKKMPDYVADTIAPSMSGGEGDNTDTVDMEMSDDEDSNGGNSRKNVTSITNSLSMPVPSITEIRMKVQRRKQERLKQAQLDEENKKHGKVNEEEQYSPIDLDIDSPVSSPDPEPVKHKPSKPQQSSLESRIGSMLNRAMYGGTDDKEPEDKTTKDEGGSSTPVLDEDTEGAPSNPIDFLTNIINQSKKPGGLKTSSFLRGLSKLTKSVKKQVKVSRGEAIEDDDDEDDDGVESDLTPPPETTRKRTRTDSGADHSSGGIPIVIPSTQHDATPSIQTPGLPSSGHQTAPMVSPAGMFVPRQVIHPQVQPSSSVAQPLSPRQQQIPGLNPQQIPGLNQQQQIPGLNQQQQIPGLNHQQQIPGLNQQQQIPGLNPQQQIPGLNQQQQIPGLNQQQQIPGLNPQQAPGLRPPQSHLGVPLQQSPVIPPPQRQPGHPQQQGPPQQGMPLPQQRMPPPQGMPPQQGIPQPGQQAISPQGNPQQGMPPRQGMPPQQGIPQQQGLPPQGVPPRPGIQPQFSGQPFNAPSRPDTSVPPPGFDPNTPPPGFKSSFRPGGQPQSPQITPQARPFSVGFGGPNQSPSPTTLGPRLTSPPPRAQVPSYAALPGMTPPSPSQLYPVHQQPPMSQSQQQAPMSAPQSIANLSNRFPPPNTSNQFGGPSANPVPSPSVRPNSVSTPEVQPTNLRVIDRTSMNQGGPSNPQQVDSMYSQPRAPMGVSPPTGNMFQQSPRPPLPHSGPSSGPPTSTSNAMFQPPPGSALYGGVPNQVNSNNGPTPQSGQAPAPSSVSEKLAAEKRAEDKLAAEQEEFINKLKRRASAPPTPSNSTTEADSNSAKPPEPKEAPPPPRQSEPPIDPNKKAQLEAEAQDLIEKELMAFLGGGGDKSDSKKMHSVVQKADSDKGSDRGGSRERRISEKEDRRSNSAREFEHKDYNHGGQRKRDYDREYDRDYERDHDRRESRDYYDRRGSADYYSRDRDGYDDHYRDPRDQYYREPTYSRPTKRPVPPPIPPPPSPFADRKGRFPPRF